MFTQKISILFPPVRCKRLGSHMKVQLNQFIANHAYVQESSHLSVNTYLGLDKGQQNSREIGFNTFVPM